MNTNILIPTKINVGFQERSVTYTGKLAYIIYFDEKGKLRKGRSWQNWRDESIPNEIYDNEPTEGFVLNKKAGDYNGDWGYHRQAYCRVYDPRGFEFEITINNLLWILENADCIRGKGLDGQFIYGWDGKDLLLVPCASPDYKLIIEKNKVIHNDKFIKAKDLIIGATYEMLNGKQYVYMGKSLEYKTHYNQYFNYRKGYQYPVDETWHKDIEVEQQREILSRCITNGKKQFWFIKLGDKNAKYSYDKADRPECFSHVTRKFSNLINANCHSNYIEFTEMLKRDSRYVPIDFESNKIIKLPFDNFVELASRKSKNGYFWFDVGIKIDEHHLKRTIIYYSEEKECFVQNGINYNSIEELYNELNPVYGEQYLTNGELYRRCYYYGTEE